MFRALKSVWETAFGLVVEDGSLAIGILAVLVVVWVSAHTTGDAAGWILLALLAALVLFNVYMTGRRARGDAR